MKQREKESKSKEWRTVRGKSVRIARGGEWRQAGRIGYGISIKQTEIPWEKSHFAPLDWYDVTAHEMNIAPRIRSVLVASPIRSSRYSLLLLLRVNARYIVSRVQWYSPLALRNRYPKTISETETPEDGRAHRFPDDILEECGYGGNYGSRDGTKLVSTVLRLAARANLRS